VAIVDLDGDGDLDLVTDLSAYHQVKSGTFEPDADLVAAFAPRSVADMDGDGDQDLLSLDPKTSKLSIFLQTSPGRFDPDPVLVGNPPGQPWVILTVFWGGH
jgi:hypothetical protein